MDRGYYGYHVVNVFIIQHCTVIVIIVVIVIIIVIVIVIVIVVIVIVIIDVKWLKWYWILIVISDNHGNIHCNGCKMN